MVASPGPFWPFSATMDTSLSRLKVKISLPEKAIGIWFARRATAEWPLTLENISVTRLDGKRLPLLTGLLDIILFLPFYELLFRLRPLSTCLRAAFIAASLDSDGSGSVDLDGGAIPFPVNFTSRSTLSLISSSVFP